jgi:hypothetical protein
MGAIGPCSRSSAPPWMTRPVRGRGRTRLTLRVPMPRRFRLRSGCWTSEGPIVGVLAAWASRSRAAQQRAWLVRVDVEERPDLAPSRSHPRTLRSRSLADSRAGRAPPSEARGGVARIPYGRTVAVRAEGEARRDSPVQRPRGIRHLPGVALPRDASRSITLPDGARARSSARVTATCQAEALTGRRRPNVGDRSPSGSSSASRYEPLGRRRTRTILRRCRPREAHRAEGAPGARLTRSRNPRRTADSAPSVVISPVARQNAVHASPLPAARARPAPRLRVRRRPRGQPRPIAPRRGPRTSRSSSTA